MPEMAKRRMELTGHLEEVALDREAVPFGQVSDIGLVGWCVQADGERSVAVLTSGAIPCEGMCDLPPQDGTTDALAAAIRADGSTEVDASCSVTARLQPAHAVPTT